MFTRYRIHWLLLATILFLSSYLIHYYHNKPHNIVSVALGLKEGLVEMEKDFYDIIQDKGLVYSIISQRYSQKEQKELTDKAYTIFIYEGDKLIFWNNNQVDIPKSSLAAYPMGVNYVKLKNGYYQLLKKEITNIPSPEPLKAIAVQLIKYDYEYENQYLQNTLNPALKLPNGIRFLPTKKSATAYPLTNDESRNHIYLDYEDNYVSKPVFWSMILGFCFIIVIMLLVTDLAIDWSKKGRDRRAFFMLLLAFWGVYLFIFRVGFPISIQEFTFFNLNESGSFFWGRSLGSLIIASFFILWISIYFNRYFDHLSFINWLNKKPRLGAFLLMLTYTLITFLFIDLMRTLVVDFQVSIDVSKLLDLGQLSTLGLLTLAAGIFNYFMLGHRIAYYLVKLNIKLIERIILLLIASIPLIIWLFYTAYSLKELIMIGWAFFFIWQIGFFKTRAKENFDLSWLLGWSLFLATFMTFLLDSYESHKEDLLMKKYAQQLSQERDNIAEFLFDDVAKSITSDRTIKYYYQRPFLPKSELIQRIKRYFDTYFTKFDIRITPYRKEKRKDIALQGNVKKQLGQYENQIERGISTNNNTLTLIPEDFGINY